MSKTLIYILSTNFEHEGIKVKVTGQLDYFNSLFNTKLISLNYKSKNIVILKAISSLKFELKSIYFLFKYHHFFIRYNPKLTLLNLSIFFLSFFKKITIEHNLKMEKELLYLNRYIEYLLHIITLNLFKKTPIQHICVNEEIKQEFINKNFKKESLCYIQNGYLSPKIDTKAINTTVLKQVEKFKVTYPTTAIFVGSGRPWHGLEKILHLFNQNSQYGLIIIGPYKTSTQKNLLYIPKSNTDTLNEIFKHCHFGISNFSWDMINITEGSPLKSRQYLCSGLPILTNYKDSAEDFKTLKPYIFNFNANKTALKKIFEHSFDKNTIKKIAQKELSWKNVYKNLTL